MRSKSRGSIDRTVSQLRLEGDWLRIVPGSFYTDGDGGFACTAAHTPEERSELTGPIWAIEDVKREHGAADKPAANSRYARRRFKRRGAQTGRRARLVGHLPFEGHRACRSF